MKQQRFPMLSTVTSLDMLDDDLVQSCASFSQALGVSRAMGRRKWSDVSLSAELGLQPSVWSRIQHKPKDSPAYMPEDRFPTLCDALGNVGVLQWLCARVGYRMVPIAETFIQRKRRELAELEAAEAAA